MTEEIYCNLNEDEETIMTSPWPVYDEALSCPQQETEVDLIKEAVRGIRNLRTSMNVPASRKASVYVVSDRPEVLRSFEESTDFFKVLASASETHLQVDKSGIADDAVSAVISGAQIYMPLEDLVDISKEIERLEKESGRLEGEIARSAGMLGNERFIAKAPASKVEEERAKLARYEEMLGQVRQQLEHLKR